MRYLPLLLLLLLAACDTGTPEGVYPPPGNYPTVALAEMLTVEPGRYNTDGVVIAIEECPPQTDCLVPDHIVLGQFAGDDPPQIGLQIWAERPSQFELGAAYRVSVEATERPGGGLEYTLLGYARLTSFD